MGLLLLDAGEDHAAFLVGVPFPEDLPRSLGCRHDDLPVVLRRLGEDDIMARAGLGVFLEAVGDGEDDHLTHEGVLFPEILDGFPGKGGT